MLLDEVSVEHVKDRFLFLDNKEVLEPVKLGTVSLQMDKFDVHPV